jgi:histidine ammonia-lyase
MESRNGASVGETLAIQPGAVPLAAWRRIMRERLPVRLPPEARHAVDRCHAVVRNLLGASRAIYGVNTGFGKLADVRIASDQLHQLQRNLILSHSTGTGDLLDDGLVHLILVMKAGALAQGHSGVRWEVIETLLTLANAGVYPTIPAKGSVGASGDLAPLAHLAASLMAVGETRHRGETLPAAEGLRRAGVEPIVLGPKEGVALINGTQVSTALALHGLLAAEELLRAALVTGALTLEACRGDDGPFDARIQAVRRHRGQQIAAAALRGLLADSPLRQEPGKRRKVQDPYCLRCQPQVMGACLDTLGYAAGVLVTEANAVTDNPLVFPDEREVLSGGNFHAEPVAFAADIIALSLCEIGSMSERRQAMLVDATLSGLPAFLVENSGLNSGFMMTQVTAAALTAENKMLAHPASVDSIPTSANQEDHVSMACHGAYRLGQMADNLAGIVALEWLAAAQGVEFHRPLTPSPPLAEAVRRLRAEVPRLEQDRYLAPDIAAAKRLLRAGALSDLAGSSLLDGDATDP